MEKGDTGIFGGGKDYVQIRGINTKRQFLVEGGVDGAQYSLNGHIFLWYNSDEISIWDSSTGARLWNTRWSAGARPVKSVFSRMKPIAISPDSVMVAVGIDEFILCWDIGSGKLRHTISVTFPGFQELRSISILPSGDIIAAGDWEDSSPDQPNIVVKKSFWHHSKSSSQLHRYFLNERFHTMTVSVNRRSVAFLTSSQVSLFDISTGHQEHILQGAAHTYSSFDQLALLVLPDTVAMASIDTAMTEDGVQVKIWDLRPGTCPCRIIRLPESIQSDSLFTSVAFSPNGETLAFGKADGSIHRIQTDFSKWKKESSKDYSASSQDKVAYFQEEKTRSHLPSLEDLFK